MLNQLRQMGILRFGPQVLSTRYSPELLQCIAALENELAQDDVPSARSEQLARNCVKYDDFQAAEFADYYNTVASHFHNPTKESAQRVSRHSYPRRFYTPGHHLSNSRLIQDFLE